MSKKEQISQSAKVYATLTKSYNQGSVRARIEAFFLDNVGKVVSRSQLLKVARDPKTKREPENWHQRLSELRTDSGYTILSWRDTKGLAVQEYMMPTTEKRIIAGRRVVPTKECWEKILKNANQSCEWNEDGQICGLKNLDIDPIGGGRIKLTPDHLNPHSLNPASDPNDPKAWRALCGRHQVMKKNFWDNQTGKLNILAILQCASLREKKEALVFLQTYFDVIEKKS